VFVAYRSLGGEISDDVEWHICPTFRRSVYPSLRIQWITLEIDMTEYELADAISSYSVQGATVFAIWLTIISAYALAAYTVGKNLSRFQITWLNTLYLYAALLMIVGFYGSWGTQIYYISEIKRLNADSPQIMGRFLQVSVTVMAFVGTFATLKFMWDIRHLKTK